METWLLAPLAAPIDNGKSKLVTFADGHSPNDDSAAIYNLLFRNVFDAHRDLPLPTSFLLDEQGQIVKIYQDPVTVAKAERDLRDIPRTNEARLAKALPFSGVSDTFQFGRNYLSLGSIFFQHGYLDAAAKFFQSGTESAETLYGLGSVYLAQQKNTEARDCFERAVKLKAGYPETAPNAWNNLGIVAAREGDSAKAVDCFKRALELNSDYYTALLNLGNAYKQLRQWESAQRTLAQAVKIKPTDAEANYSLAMVLAQTGDTTGAYEYLQRALASRPNYPEALNNLGILFLRTRRRDEAVATFEQCIRLAPAFDQAYLNLARVYSIEDNKEGARKVLQSLLVEHPDSAAAREALEQLK